MDRDEFIRRMTDDDESECNSPATYIAKAECNIKLNRAYDCCQCEWYKQPEYEEPCNQCLGRPRNINFHKPINFEAKE